MQDIRRQIASVHAEMAALRSEVRAAARPQAETKEAAQVYAGRHAAPHAGQSGDST